MRVGSYDLIEPIGRGITGVVYSARREDIALRAAVKELDAAFVADDAQVERFRSDARLMARLEHPNCVRVLDLIESEGRLFLVMELVEGESLAAVLSRCGRLDGERVLGVLRGTLSGLAHAHGLGIVHGDLRPGNILCDVAGTARVTDFGEVLDATTLRRLGAAATYTSPEVARGGHAGPPSDLYAVGVMLHEMLEGAPPFAALDVDSLLRLHDEAELPQPKLTPPALRPLLKALLARDPAERPVDAGAAQALLEAAAPGAYGVHWERRASIVGLVVAGTLASGVAATTLGTGSLAAAASTAAVPSGAPGGQVVWSGPPAPVRTELSQRQDNARSRPRIPRWARAVAAAVVLLGATALSVSGTDLSSSASGARVDGTGTAALRAGSSGLSAGCGTAELVYVFHVSQTGGGGGGSDATQLTVALLSDPPDPAINGMQQAVSVGPDGAATLRVPGVSVPPGGVAWTAAPVRLGGQAVDPGRSLPVTVTGTCR